MINLKKESGITLIALIITIIILVILAAVSIRAVTNMKIVDYAVNGSQNYVAAGKKEEKVLDDTASFIDEAVKKVSNASKEKITNPYANEAWEVAWTCTNGTWSDDITDNTQTLTGDIAAKLYKKGEEEYHLVIEKIGNSGEMGALNKNRGNFKAWTLTDNYSSNITKAIICDGITSIADGAFYLDRNLTDIEMPDSLNSIQNRAFRGCQSLTNIKIPDGVKSIGEDVFNRCENLTKIEIPSTVTSIGQSALATGANTTTVHISKNVGDISGEPWVDFDNLIVEEGASTQEGHYNIKIKWNNAEHDYHYYDDPNASGGVDI